MSTPPKFLLWLLDLFTPTSRQDLKGDFLELYDYRIEKYGKLKANLKFIRDILSVIPLLFIVKESSVPKNNPFMFITNLKIARRNFIKNKLYTAINVVGLSVSLAACVLITLYVKEELSYDKSFKKSENIYRIAGNYNQGGADPITSASSTYMLLPLIEGKIKGIEQLVRLNFHYEMITINEKDKYKEDNIIYADSTFFDIFNTPFVSGDPATALDDPSSVVIDQPTAEKYFGKEDPMGKTLELNQKVFKVSGVIKPLPLTTHFAAHIIFPMSGVEQWFPDWVLHNPSGTSMYTYFKAEDSFDKALAEKMLNELVAKQYVKNTPPTFFFQPVTSIHLQSNLDKGEIEANGSETTVYIFAITAIVILFLACINYINLSMAGSLQRVKEVGMKRIFGSTSGMQVMQFQVESFLVVSFSVVLAILLAILAMPLFNGLSGKFLAFNLLNDPAIGVALLITGIVIIMIAGGLPALMLLKFKTMSMLSGKLSTKTKSYFTNTLITFQFAISIALIASTLIVTDQMNFVKNKDLGINTEQLVMIPFADLSEKYELLRSEMLKSSSVLGIAASTNKVSNGIAGWRPYFLGGGDAGNITIPTLAVSHDFFETMGATMIDGRTFSKDFPSDAAKAYIINESAAKFIKMDKPVGNRLLGQSFTGAKWFEKDAIIIGVVKDFHFTSLHSEVGPIVFGLGSDMTEPYSWMEVRIAKENTRETIQFLTDVWNKVSVDRPFEFEFMDEDIQRKYVAEDRFLKMFVSFSVLSVLLGTLGLFGLTAFMAKRRTKEIGIRKIIGASTLRLIKVLSADFLKLVVVANIIGWPIAWYFMDKWLQNFAYRTSISIWVFLCTGVVAIIIAFAAILYHSLKISLANPVNALRSE